jgi:hypothetical protein
MTMAGCNPGAASHPLQMMDQPLPFLRRIKNAFPGRA